MTRHSLRLSWQDVILHSAAGIIIALLLWSSGLLDKIELKTFDIRVNFNATPSKASKSIVIVGLDQISLNWVEENMGITWPWPRQLYGAIIDNCKRRGAKAIGFDVIFTEYTSLEFGYDLYLKESIENSKNFALGSVFLTRDRHAPYSEWPKDIPKPSLEITGNNNDLARIPSYSRAIFPIPEIGSAAKVLCNVQHQPDSDGIYRRIHPVAMFDGELLPSLGVGMYLAHNPDAKIQILKDKIFIGEKEISIDSNGSAILNYRGPAKTFTYSNAFKFIRPEYLLDNGEITADEIAKDLEDKYVLFGFTAAALYDSKISPMGVFPGTEINATVLDNLLSSDFIHPLPGKWVIVTVTFFTLISTIIVSFLASFRAQIFSACMFFFLPGFVSIAMYRLGYAFTLVPVQIGVMTGIAFSISKAYFVVQGQEKFIRHSFKHYLSPVVIDQLINNPDRLKLGGERKELSIFFSDLEGFTKISEGLEPEDLTQLLNEYLTAMTDIILEEEGTVDKFEGDAIIAFWNAPLDIDNHAEKAVRTALRCQQKLDDLRPHFQEQYGKKLYMRIGINTGFAIVGNIGSSTRFDYSVLGDAVNLAARLEGANKYYSTYTMISSSTFEKLSEDFYCRELGRLRVVGRNEPVTVYEPLSFNIFSEEHKDFIRGLDLFYKGDFTSAFEAFKCQENKDPAAKAYCAKCKELQGKQVGEWAGVWELDSK